MSNRTCSSSGSSERGRKRARSTKEIRLQSLLFWERDLPFPNSLLGEVRRWQSLWRAKSEEGANLPHNLLLSFRFCDANAFPNIYRLLLIACTLPITSAEAERSFSLMRRLKTYARSTMSEERLSDLAVIAIYVTCSVKFIQEDSSRVHCSQMFCIIIILCTTQGRSQRSGWSGFHRTTFQ